MERLEARIRAACAKAGLEVQRIAWLPAELSLRRFARVAGAGGGPSSVVARIEAPEDPAGRPPGVPPEPPLEPIRALLERQGLPVPRRWGGEPDGSLDLLEDLGDHSLRAACAGPDPAQRRALYASACALVPRLQRVAPAAGVAAFGRALDAALFDYKAGLVIEHSLTARGRDATAAEARVVRDAFALVAERAAASPRRLAHRDFQSANLFVTGHGLVMIDLQGAFLAPPEYDLVCLLRDSYVELPPEEVRDHWEVVRAELPDAPDADSFAERFDLLTLTRKGKDHARFLYAAHVRGDARYLVHVPATVRMLREAAGRAAARDPRLADLAALFLELPESPCAP